MLNSYSKVNLILKVYRNKQGRPKHKIKSLFCLNHNLYDVIKIENTSNYDKIEYFTKQNKSVSIDNCLIKKSLDYLHNKFSIKKYYKVLVQKNIPMQSGLGGGSSNAAEVIKFVLQDNNISINRINLKEVALQLGSDIPFFLLGFDCAIVSSYGNRIKKVHNKPKCTFKVLINKNKISTKQVYDQLSKDKNYKSQIKFNKLYRNLLKNKIDINNIYNDLQPYIFQLSKSLLKDFNGVKNNRKIICGSGGSILILN